MVEIIVGMFILIIGSFFEDSEKNEKIYPVIFDLHDSDSDLE